MTLSLLYVILVAYSTMISESAVGIQTPLHRQKEQSQGAPGMDFTSKPNIILMVMDDLGFNDVPWHGHSNTQMPFLEKFVAEKALKIDTFYAMPLCSMTRSALLTGRYPMRYGLQSSVVENMAPFGLSIYESILPQDLIQQGYRTYMIGKWHLGFHRLDMTPLRRGFEEFRGSLSPMLHYFSYNYTVHVGEEEYTGYDLWINEDKVHPVDTGGRYLTDWEGDQFIDLLNDIVENDPDGKERFFLYVAMHASHDPREATEECLDLYYETECIDRDEWTELNMMQCDMHQVMQAQTSCADLTQERMLTHLMEINHGKLWDNTLLIWLSDNGAPPWDGDNSPLRGAKMELYEGGVRTPAFVSGGYLNEERYGQQFDVHTPFHVTDLYPTILAATGLKHLQRKPLDGLNQWHAIQTGIVSTETNGEQREFLYNVDPKQCETVMCGAYRYGPWKFIWSQNQIKDTAPDQMYWYDYYATNGRYNEDGTKNEEYTNYLGCGHIPDGVQFENHYDDDNNLIGALPCGDKPCLFNMEADPCEYRDLAKDQKYENLYLYLYNMLMAYYESQQLSLRAYYDDQFDTEFGNPAMNNGYWEPWVSDYGDDEGVTHFEDVMREHYNYDVSQDITLSTYYPIAMLYRAKWDQEVRDGLLEGDNNAMPLDQLESPFEGDRDLHHFKLLMFITVTVGIIISIGFATLVIRWWKTCCAIRRHALERRELMGDVSGSLRLKEENSTLDVVMDQKVLSMQQLMDQSQRREVRSWNVKPPRPRPTWSTDHGMSSINVDDIVDGIICDDNRKMMFDDFHQENVPLLNDATTSSSFSPMRR